jgi:hypothetical protein
MKAPFGRCCSDVDEDGMTMRMAHAFIVLAGLGLCGCVSRAPQLYPDNDSARATGPLVGDMLGHGGGAGTFSLTMPDGEVLSGRYSITFGGSTSFGQTFGTAYGTGGFATGSAFSEGIGISNSGVGMADMIGPKGTTAHCEFANNNWTGHGNGLCRISTGQIYRMQY